MLAENTLLNCVTLIASEVRHFRGCHDRYESSGMKNGTGKFKVGDAALMHCAG